MTQVHPHELDMNNQPSEVGNAHGRAKMRIQVMSDLHFEFHRDNGESFIKSLDPTGIDVLVLAGDIATRTLASSLISFCEKYSEVVFVCGNHEYYEPNLMNIRKEEWPRIKTKPINIFKQVHDTLDKMNQILLNFHWLRNDSVTLSGQRFLGTTLWFKDDPLNVCHANSLADFLIPGFEDFVYPENETAMKFLLEETQPGDVVVTHHIPTNRSVRDEWKTNVLNRFFVCDIERELFDREPRLVCHGHTHIATKYSAGPTLVLNPGAIQRTRCPSVAVVDVPALDVTEVPL